MPTRVLEALTATLVLHYPQLKALSVEAPLVHRLDACTVGAGSDATEAAFAVERASGKRARVGQSSATSRTSTSRSSARPRRCHHPRADRDEPRAVRPPARVRGRSASTSCSRQHGTRAERIAGDEASAVEAQAPKRLRRQRQQTCPPCGTNGTQRYHASGRARTASLSPTRGCWRRTSSSSCRPGFAIVEKAASFKDDVLALGTAAQAATLSAEFLRDHGVTAGGAGTVLKALRKLRRREGALDDRIWCTGACLQATRSSTRRHSQVKTSWLSRARRVCKSRQLMSTQVHCYIHTYTHAYMHTAFHSTISLLWPLQAHRSLIDCRSTEYTYPHACTHIQRLIQHRPS